MDEKCLKHMLPEGAVNIIDKLNVSGFSAYIVGGCIRDVLLGKKPSDWDIATEAAPAQVKNLFEKTVDTGIGHGTVSVFACDGKYEVTTYRTESGYSDYRHPDRVCFTSSLEGDLKRRDFTINAMAYHPVEGLIDIFGGINDLKRRVIKTVGEPSERFSEDALRMLRAARFSAQLGFEIDEYTFSAICKNRDLIKRISKERIRDELDMLLLTDNPSRFVLLWESGLLEWVVPELHRSYMTFASKQRIGELLLPLDYSDKDRITRWSLLLWHVDNPGIAMRRLKFDKKSTGIIAKVCGSMDMDVTPDPVSVRKAVHEVGKPVFMVLLDAWDAIRKSGSRMYGDAYRNVGADIKCSIRPIYEEIISRGDALEIKELAINGHDISGLGLSGESVGRVLDRIMEMVIENPNLNERDTLLKIAKEYIS
jgi:tRNA nucleotidyltransferase (CCA-adding enzyme)